METMEEIIKRIAMLLAFDVSLDEVRDVLLKEKMLEGTVFLTVKAAELYNANHSIEE